MEIIKNFDFKWFWLGYSVGVNSRKKISDSPNKILNLGKQGIKKIPSYKQKVSFAMGMQLGRRKIVNNFNIIKIVQYQDANAHKIKGDYLNLGLGSVEAERGQTVILPLYICNNSVDNRGSCGFQAKIKYNPNYLTLTNISQSSSWPYQFNYQHDAVNGIVLIQGMSNNVEYIDRTLAYLSFTVGYNTPATQTIFVQGPSGTGQNSDLFTLINEELYYIMPLQLENGKIVLEEQQQEEVKEVVNVPPIGSDSDYFGPNTELNYSFTCGLSYVGSAGGSGGGGSGGGASMLVRITTGDGYSTVVSIPLQDGTHTYSGKLPVPLPSLSKGPIKIEYWVEPNDPDDIYYWFIKAGALWSFETEIPRDEVGELPIEEPKISVYEYLIILEYVLFEEIGGVGPVPSDTEISVNEILSIIDDFILTSEELEEFSVNEIIKLMEFVLFELIRNGEPVPAPELIEVAEIIKVIDSLSLEEFELVILSICEKLGISEEVLLEKIKDGNPEIAPEEMFELIKLRLKDELSITEEELKNKNSSDSLGIGEYVLFEEI